MKKYYKKLPNGKWKTYIQLFMDKKTEQRLYLKPGITEFYDGDARMFFNNLKEEESFLQHFKTKVMWSKVFNTKAEAESQWSKSLWSRLGFSYNQLGDMLLCQVTIRYILFQRTALP